MGQHMHHIGPDHVECQQTVLSASPPEGGKKGGEAGAVPDVGRHLAFSRKVLYIHREFRDCAVSVTELSTL